MRFFFDLFAFEGIEQEIYFGIIRNEIVFVVLNLVRMVSLGKDR